MFGKKQIVNLEIRDYVIRFSESNVSSTSNVERIGEHFLPSGIIVNGVIEKGEAFLKILKTCVKKWKLKGKSVRLTLPEAVVIVRKQDIPADIKKDQINQHIQFQLGETIHLPFERPIVRTIYLNEEEGSHTVSLISTDEQLVSRYTELLHEAKLKVIAADLSSFNYYRVFHQQQLVDAMDHVLFMQYYVDHVVFSAFHNHTPIFLQEFDLEAGAETSAQLGPTMSKEDFHEEVVLEELDDISTEIERIERFYQYSMNQDEQRFTKIAVAGDHPFMNEIISQMKESNEIPVIHLEDNRIQGPKGLTLEQKFHSVYGLALKGGQ
ncbi:type IV pilus biogenesis protein PilM [Halalkalibacillus halophilus]|uniref:type IV pilus biogenesis protein PilM n=1 Tax=Halalkalibacillus halophilus TaxID=392827 RepID=UPI00041F1911|nr:pilus assembly protein PilM [Halalkalibacillus halophilus]